MQMKVVLMAVVLGTRLHRSHIAPEQLKLLSPFVKNMATSRIRILIFFGTGPKIETQMHSVG